MELIVKNKDTAALEVMSELKNYNKFVKNLNEETHKERLGIRFWLWLW